jgi:hypothetical protein
MIILLSNRGVELGESEIGSFKGTSEKRLRNRDGVTHQEFGGQVHPPDFESRIGVNVAAVRDDDASARARPFP